MGNWDVGITGVVLLPGGRYVRGRGLREGAPRGAAAPEFGLYFTSKPHYEEGWESRWVCWPDVRLPRSSIVAVDALRDAYERSAKMMVEIACGGGNGRTGAAIAILARYAGVPAEDAVAWARANYRTRDVETPFQRRFVRAADLAR